MYDDGFIISLNIIIKVINAYIMKMVKFSSRKALNSWKP